MPLPAPATAGATNGSAAVARTTGALPGAAQLPPHGPSSVLAQASGLGKQSNLGSRVRIALIAVVVLLAAGSYLLLRDRLTGPSRLTDSGRNLLSAEEQSAFLVRMGQRDREQGHSEAAISYFKTALSLTPNNPDIHFLLGQTYAGAGHNDEAMKSYQSLLRIVPDHLEARLQVAEIHRARGNWIAALQEYQRIIALDQNSPQAAVALSIMESQNTGKPEIADANLRRPRNVVKKIPVALPGAVAQAKVSLMLPGQAATRIQPPSAIAGRPEERPDPRAVADGHKKLGLRYFGVRQYRAAINEFLSALRLTPEDKDIYYFLGSSYFGLGELALAHDYYKRVDSGIYVGVAQSGAKNTEKAAREEAKRRELLKSDPVNQVKNDLNQKSKGRLNNSLE
jgi:tetratricopeptide (TPR) repeat protein